jgi:hypothetical protein
MPLVEPQQFKRDHGVIITCAQPIDSEKFAEIIEAFLQEISLLSGLSNLGAESAASIRVSMSQVRAELGLGGWRSGRTRTDTIEPHGRWIRRPSRPPDPKNQALVARRTMVAAEGIFAATIPTRHSR